MNGDFNFSLKIRKRHQREREELVLRAIEVAGSKASASTDT